MGKKRWLSIGGIALAILVIGTVVAWGQETINVPGDHGTIQEAIDAASAGDTIIVAAGTYDENVVVDKALTLQGATGATIEPAAGCGVEIQASDITVDGFTINTIGLDAHGIYISVGATGLAITGNDITIGGGSTAIYADAGPSQVAKSSGWTISGNTLSAAAGCNLELYDVDAVTIDDNVFKNTAGSNVIVSSELFDLTGPIAFTNNDVQGNDGGSMVAFVTDFQKYITGTRTDAITTSMDNVTITGNTFDDWDGRGLRIGDWGGDVTNVTINYNSFLGTGRALDNMDAALLDARNNWWGSANGPTHAGNTFNVAAQGSAVSDNVQYVPWYDTDKTGTSFSPIEAASFYSSIQAAIDAAADGTVITCAAGTFTEDIVLDVPNLELVGAGATTIIQGVAQRVHTDWPNATANIDVRGAGAVLHDFTFRNPAWVNGFYSSGMIVGATNVDIHDVDFIGPTSDDTDDLSQCFQTWNTVDISGLDLHDNTFTTDGAEAWGYEAVYINTGGVGEVRIRSNTMQGKLFRGISTIRENVTISGNTIVTTADPANAWAGINVDANNVRVQNNVIEGASGFGVGIDVGAAAMTLQDIELFGNDIGPGNDIGIRVRGTLDTGVVVRFCDIVGNVTSGIDASALTGGNLDAEQNWWNSDSGPSGQGPGTGDSVSTNVDYDPWIQSTVEGTATETVAAGETLDAQAELGMEVDVEGAAADVTVSTYTDNPGGAGFGTNAGFFDVFVPNVGGVTQITVRFYYPSTIVPPDEANLKASYWDEGTSAWVECSNQTLNTADIVGPPAYGGYIEVTITATTIPTLNDLTGTIFGSGWTQPASVFWYEDFEYANQAAMEAAGWVFGANAEQLWHLTSEAAVPSLAYPNLVAFPSSDHAVWFADPNQGSYGPSVLPTSVSPEVRGQRTRIQPMGAGQGYPYGELTSPAIDVTGKASVDVSFTSYREVECYPQGYYDKTDVLVSFDNGVTWQKIWGLDSTTCTGMREWLAAGGATIPVAVPTGATSMKIRFVFDAVDKVANDYLGWLVDDLKVSSSGPSSLAFQEHTLPEGIAGEAYNETLHVVGGTPPYEWRVTKDPDWAGLSVTFNATTNAFELTGTAPAASNPPNHDVYTVCFMVTDFRGVDLPGCFDIIVEYAIDTSVIWYDDLDPAKTGWTAGGLWHLAVNTPCVAPSYASPTHAYYYGKDATCNYVTGVPNSGTLKSPEIDDANGLVGGSQLTIGWKYWREVEYYDSGAYDKTKVEVSFNGTTWKEIWYQDSKDSSVPGWHLVEASTYTDGTNIAVPFGASLWIRFVFETVDSVANDHVGWLIDDVKVIQQVPEAQPLAISTTCPLPAGAEGQAYGPLQLQATGGSGSYQNWTISTGALPAGLSLSTAGVLSGTPAAGTAAGSPHNFTLSVGDNAGNNETKACTITITSCPCDLATLDFTNDLTDSTLAAAWTTSGLWHVTDNGCAASCLSTGKYAYFGQDATCDYDTGGTVTGYLTSPTIPVDPCILAIAIGFDQLREVEVYATGSYDRSFVEVRWNTGGWGAWTTVWAKDSGDASPGCDTGGGVGNIPVAAGATGVQVRFGFDSVDALFNGFFGWALDNIWVKNDDCVGSLTAPLSVHDVQVESEDRLALNILNIPNPIRDVNTTTFSVRGVGIEAIKVQIFDLNQSLIYEEEVSGTDLIWHTVNSYGEYLANGVYFYRALVLRGGVWSVTGFEKLIILR